MMHSIASAFTDALAAARQRIHRPIVVIWMGAMESTVATLEAARIPVFLDIPQAMRALAAAVRVGTLQRAALTASLPSKRPASAAATRRVLTEWDGKQLLRSQQAVALPEGVLVPAATSPGPFTESLNYPVAAKLQASALTHKSDVGGVVLRIGSDEALVDAVDRLNAVGSALQLDLQGVLVEQMIPFDHELLLGLRRDARFGEVLTLARGGVEVELDADAVTRLLPLDATQVEAMLRGLRSARLLDGFRGRPAADIPAVARRIANLCDWFLANEALEEIEINPLAVRGSDVWALDALVTQGT
jgi:acyl-CoA synthetase (NDP forming)